MQAPNAPAVTLRNDTVGTVKNIYHHRALDASVSAGELKRLGLH